MHLINLIKVNNMRVATASLIFILWNLSFVSLAKAGNDRFSNDVLSVSDLSSTKAYVSNIKLHHDDSVTFQPNLSFQDYLIEKKTAQFKSTHLSASISRATPVPWVSVGSDYSNFSNLFNTSQLSLIRRDRTHVQLTKEFDDLKVSAGVSNEEAVMSNQLSSFSAPYVKLSEFNTERKIAAVELEKKMNNEHIVLAATLGAVREYGAVVGCCSSNPSLLNLNPSARFFSFAASYAPSSWVSFFGQASLAYTKSIDNDVSLSNNRHVISGTPAVPAIKDVSSAKLFTWSLGLSARNFLQVGDKVGVVLAMPVKILSGSMGVYNSVGADGQISRVNLSQTGTEMNMELSYSAYVGKSSTFTAASIYRRQPNHDADAPPSVGVSVRMVTQF